RRSSVVLPEPEAPSSAAKLPAGIDRSRRSRTGAAPKRFVSPSTASAPASAKLLACLDARERAGEGAVDVARQGLVGEQPLLDRGARIDRGIVLEILVDGFQRRGIGAGIGDLVRDRRGDRRRQ